MSSRSGHRSWCCHGRWSWRCCGCRSWRCCGCWGGRRRRRHWARSGSGDPDVGAIAEFFKAGACSGVGGLGCACILHVWNRAFVVRASPSAEVETPTERRELLLVATVRHHVVGRTVGCGPEPLQRAVRALEARRDAVVDLVNTHPRWVIPTARVVWVDGLTVFPRIIRHTVIMELRGWNTHERKLLEASHSPIVAVNCAVADEELMMALMVHVHAHLELHNTASGVGAVWLSNRAHIIAADSPLVAVPADRPRSSLAAAIPTMGAMAVLAWVEHVTCRRLHHVAMAGDKRQDGQEDRGC
mmetsp:Transcript_58934/g.126657  ORF Transcript_58934/g.126657 Transcript_58934/m.126657 type:complete len:300 (-) Transcript_58934:83-982(-)